MVWKDPALRTVAGVSATVNLGNAVVMAVILLFAYRGLRLSAGEVGISTGVGSFGFMAGALVAPRLTAALGMPRTLLLGALLFGAAFMLLPLGQLGAPLAAYTGTQLLSSFVLAVYNVGATTLIQTAAAGPVLGRVNAAVIEITWSTLALGSLAGGVLADRVGLVPCLVAGSVLITLGSLWVALGPGFEAPPVRGSSEVRASE
jgi:MFS-type transporter involved in bile tolerance (Atg22 family)